MSYILITGSSGFIGSHLYERMLLRGHYVLGVDNYSTSKPFMDVKRCDICNDEFMDVFLDFGPEIVLHCAASYKNPFAWAEDARTNCYGTAKLVELCKISRVRKLVFLQTSLIYGANPISSPIKIDASLFPTSDSYTISKLYAERIIAMSGVPFVSLRLSNCYGPRNLNGAIPAIYKKIKAGESPTVVDTRRCFVYVDDLVELIGRIIDGEGKRNYYHISSGTDNSIWEVYNEIGASVKKLTGIDFPIASLVQKSPHEVSTLLLDPSQTLEDFPGWSLKIPLKEGIMKAVKWYEEHGVGEVYTHLRRD